MKDPQFSNRLNLCLDKEGFPPKNRGRIQLLAEMVGLTHRGASKWINGESIPPAKKFASLAMKLNVSEKWLRFGEGSMLESRNTLPKQNCTNDEIAIYRMDNFLSEEKKIEKIIQWTPPYEGHFFGIILDTEAMSPRFPKNSILLFDQMPAKDGDFVLVCVKDFPAPIFRQLLIIGETFYLNAHNPKFERLILTEFQYILGKLIQAIISFD